METEYDYETPELDELVEAEPEHVVADDVAPAGPTASVLDRLRARRAELQSERTEVFEIPGYNGLRGRYGIVEWDFLKKVAKRTEKSKHPRKELYAIVDTLIESCKGIEVFDGSDWKPMHEVFGGDQVVRYDANLAEALGYPATSAREAVFGLFPSDIAMTAHMAEVDEWMKGASEEEDDNLMGESEGTGR